MNAPFIGITCNVLRNIPETVTAGIGAPEQSWQLLAEDYLRMIEKAGGIPVMLPIGTDPLCACHLWERLDGILLSGGNDVSPMLYQERISPKCGALDNSRDQYEIALAKFAVERGIPILGICRGLQIFNVAFGGSLYQDLPSSGFELHTILTNPRNEGTHSVVLESETPLAKIMEASEIMVNSFHHQAVRSLAPPLQKMAVSEDGVIEAAYLPGAAFAMAVQWHPEMMYDNEQQQKIASALVEAGKKFKTARKGEHNV